MIIGSVPILGWVISFFGWLAIFILVVMGIIKALQGEKWELPYLGRLASKINL